jgi:hypothetical protein
MSDYALDCCFDAKVTPWNSGESVVMAYGYASLGQNGWGAGGQAAKVMSEGDQIYFSVFDTSSSCSRATVSVSFGRGHTADPSQSPSPLSDPDTTTLANGLSLKLDRGAESAGCNVKGKGGTLGPYSLQNTGDFEMTVTVVTSDGKTFSVDPEMEIIRGGGG